MRHLKWVNFFRCWAVRLDDVLEVWNSFIYQVERLKGVGIRCDVSITYQVGQSHKVPFGRFLRCLELISFNQVPVKYRNKILNRFVLLMYQLPRRDNPGLWHPDLYDYLVLDNKSFKIYSATILFRKIFNIFSVFESLLLYSQGLVLNAKSITNIFIWPIFGVTFAESIVILSNPDSITNFKFRSFRICFNFFSQSRIISINRICTNRTMTSIIVFIY